MTDTKVLSSAIESALTAAASAVSRITPDTWECVTCDDGARVTVQLSGDWLLFDAPGTRVFADADVGATPYWDVLAANARLPLGVKFALAASVRPLRVRAEMPIMPDLDVAERVVAVWASCVNALSADPFGRNPSPAPSPRDGTADGCDRAPFDSAQDRLRDGPRKRGLLSANGNIPRDINPSSVRPETSTSSDRLVRWANEPDRLEAGPTGGTGFQPVAVHWQEPPSFGGVSKGEDRASSDALDLAALCAAARWPFNARDDGTLAAPLEVNGAFQQATVAANADDGVLVWTSILGGDAVGPGACRDALGLLLLRACGVFRMVRAAVEVASDAARFEVVLGPRPTSEELARALSALSVAWRLAAREARVVSTDVGVAQAYLAGGPGTGGGRA